MLIHFLFAPFREREVIPILGRRSQPPFALDAPFQDAKENSVR
jgi:hypothetical protein